jgi:hypothetical protein
LKADKGKIEIILFVIQLVARLSPTINFNKISKYEAEITISKQTIQLEPNIINDIKSRTIMKYYIYGEVHVYGS